MKPKIQLQPFQASILLYFVLYFALSIEHPLLLCKHLHAFAYVVFLTCNHLSLFFVWLTLLILQSPVP